MREVEFVGGQRERKESSGGLEGSQSEQRGKTLGHDSVSSARIDEANLSTHGVYAWLHCIQHTIKTEAENYVCRFAPGKPQKAVGSPMNLKHA
ncbi:hypothetical protein PUN4_10023 [Paraburkholderia unamae]|nr:hypothetical protein PUN4_10023 [Paraburkholderia unamae]